MCLAVPAKVIEIKDQMATVEVRGVQRPASLMLLPEAKIGDYVLVHAGMIIQTIKQQEAEEMTALFKELEEI